MSKVLRAALSCTAVLAKGRIGMWESRAQSDSFLENPYCLVQECSPKPKPGSSLPPSPSFLRTHQPQSSQAQAGLNTSSATGVVMGPERGRPCNPTGQKEAEVKV